MRRSSGLTATAVDFARGLEAYYSGDPKSALQLLSRWCDAGADGPESWHRAARRVLMRASDGVDLVDPGLAGRARRLLEALEPASA